MTATGTERPVHGPGGLRARRVAPAIRVNAPESVEPPPPGRRVPRGVVIAGALAVGLATVAAVAVVTGADDAPRRRIVLADRIGDRVRLPDDGTVELKRADYGTRVSASGPYRELAVGGYGAADTRRTTLIVIGLTGDFPEPSEELRKYFGGFHTTPIGYPVIDLREHPAGPLGGRVQCALLAFPYASETHCVWADGSTVGIVVDSAGGTPTADLAARTLEIRAAVEAEVEAGTKG